MWKELVSDVNPLRYGGVFWRRDGWDIETLEIQPVIEYVGAREARDVGFPLWTKEGQIDKIDLIGALSDGDALRSIGADSLIGRSLETLAEHEIATLVYALHVHGGHTSEGPCGFATDLQDLLCQLPGIWPDDCAECDADFRQEIG